MDRMRAILPAAALLALSIFVGKVLVSAQQETRTMYFKHAVVRGIPVNVVYINLSHPNVRIAADVSQPGIGKSESFRSFVARSKPAAAINGTFFCTSSLRPIGDIVAHGRVIHSGGMGTGLCITAEKKVSFVTPPRYRHVSWEGYDTVVCSGPRLLTGKRACVAPRHEGFRDPRVLGKARRTAVGVTYLDRLLLLTTEKECTLTQLALVMKDLGCTDSINFDGGSSSGMYYRGKIVTSPGRSLTNVLLVYD